jgi:hypothetical protein
MSIASAALADNLGNLECVDITVERLEHEADQAGLTEESLSNALLVALKSKAPRFRVDSTCLPYVYVNVIFLLIKSEDGHIFGYAFNLSLELYREAYIRKIDQTHLLSVWQRSGLYLGPKHLAKATVLERLDEFVTEFAAAYYKAGNP